MKARGKGGRFLARRYWCRTCQCVTAGHRCKVPRVAGWTGCVHCDACGEVTPPREIAAIVGALR